MRMPRGERRHALLPALTAAGGGCLLWVAVWSGFDGRLGELLAFDAARVAQGEWWRLLSGFIAHWTPLHAAANAIGIAGFAWLIAGRESAQPLRIIALSSLALQVGALLSLPGNAQYRGASGFLYALAAFAFLRALQSAKWRTWLALIAVAGVTRIVADMSGHGASMLLPAGIVSAWPIHLAGIGAGLLAFLFARQRDDARRGKRAALHNHVIDCMCRNRPACGRCISTGENHEQYRRRRRHHAQKSAGANRQIFRRVDQYRPFAGDRQT